MITPPPNNNNKNTKRCTQQRSCHPRWICGQESPPTKITKRSTPTNITKRCTPPNKKSRRDVPSALVTPWGPVDTDAGRSGHEGRAPPAASQRGRLQRQRSRGPAAAAAAAGLHVRAGRSPPRRRPRHHCVRGCRVRAVSQEKGN